MSMLTLVEEQMNTPFPSLTIRGNELIPKGTFAESQMEFLDPSQENVVGLANALKANDAGVVAHFYMDVELQGVLTAAKKLWPHIHISDSLAMADRAVAMAQAGVGRVFVLGVDFMSENVRAILDSSGFESVDVYRMDPREIGCSLAESAKALTYGAWLHKAAKMSKVLHVIYINTALDTKGRSHHVVPTITCTSSNVVQTILQASAQVPGVRIWYGPDTYMGENLLTMFEEVCDWPDEGIRKLHPSHSQATIRGLLNRFEYFRQGTCVVHHMFGAQVVSVAQEHYPDAHYTAHLEVPGEMFRMATEAAARGRGVVGSTSNILDYIKGCVSRAIDGDEDQLLRFVLGTEAGMITSIVDGVQTLLTQNQCDGIEVEIIFPVANEAVSMTPEHDLGIVPGVSGGEGCSAAGGCATCPYMKMNSLEALFDLLDRLGEHDLSAYHPRKYTEKIGGRSAADIGGEPILHMRHFQATGQLPEALVAHVLG